MSNEMSKRDRIDIEEMKALYQRLSAIDDVCYKITAFFYTINVALLLILINFMREETYDFPKNILLIALPLLGFVSTWCIFHITCRVWVYGWEANIHRINFLLARIRGLKIDNLKGYLYPAKYIPPNQQDRQIFDQDIKWYDYYMNNELPINLSFKAGWVLVGFHFLFMIVWLIALFILILPYFFYPSVFSLIAFIPIIILIILLLNCIKIIIGIIAIQPKKKK